MSFQQVNVKNIWINIFWRNGIEKLEVGGIKKKWWFIFPNKFSFNEHYSSEETIILIRFDFFPIPLQIFQELISYQLHKEIALDKRLMTKREPFHCLPRGLITIQHHNGQLHALLTANFVLYTRNHECWMPNEWGWIVYGMLMWKINNYFPLCVEIAFVFHPLFQLI